MLQAHIIDPLGPGGLKPLSRRLIDPRAAQGQSALDDAMRRNKWDWATVPVDFPAYHMYAALDTVLSCRLHDRFSAKVGPGKEWAEIYELELAVRNVCTRMEQRGARVDVEYAERKSKELLAYADQLRDWCKQHYGVSISSGAQLTKVFQKLGTEFEVFSGKTGNPSTDKYQLRIFAGGGASEVAQLATTVLRYRKAQKFGQDYFQKFADISTSENDGDIIHASIRTLAARTSRMSISQPALQQVPKQDALVRNAFIPREGNVLISADYAQIEMRLEAHFSGDADLQQAFKDADASGGDFFVEMGRAIYDDPGFQKSDKRRGLVKNVMYGSVYGAGPAKMAESAGVPLEQMKPVVDALNARFPGLKAFMRRIEHEGVQRERSGGEGFVVTPYGRRLPCDEGKIYTLVNFLLQGHAAEFFKKALVNLDAAGWGDVMLLPVHDEIVLDLPAADAKQAIHDVPLIMQDLENYSVPLLAESDGPWSRWGEKYA